VPADQQPAASAAGWAGAGPLLDAAKLAGLLAEPTRLRVVAATGLEPRQAGTALARLIDAELVVRGADGTHVLLEAAFADAARAAAPPPAPADEPGGAPAEAARALRVFFRDGRLRQIPMQRTKRLVVLDRLAQEFEPGRRYSERAVNLALLRWHDDTAALRRYLVDEGFLSRERGEYWRSGGTVSVG
jgi:hypothetical protein